MKAILLSIQPEFVAKILNGDKTIEIRKGKSLLKAVKELIGQYGEATFYIHCTRGNQNLIKTADAPVGVHWDVPYIALAHFFDGIRLNGKIVARFVCKNAEKINYGKIRDIDGLYGHYTSENTLSSQRSLEDGSGLAFWEIDSYLRENIGTAIHISDLVIFDKPKELIEFRHPLLSCGIYCDDNLIPSFCRLHCSHNTDPERLDVWCDRNDKLWEPITKAPRSWCYAEPLGFNVGDLVRITPKCADYDRHKDEVFKVLGESKIICETHCTPIRFSGTPQYFATEFLELAHVRPGQCMEADEL